MRVYCSVTAAILLVSATGCGNPSSTTAKRDENSHRESGEVTPRTRQESPSQYEDGEATLRYWMKVSGRTKRCAEQIAEIQNDIYVFGDRDEDMVSAFKRYAAELSLINRMGVDRELLKTVDTLIRIIESVTPRDTFDTVVQRCRNLRDEVTPFDTLSVQLKKKYGLDFPTF